MGKASIISSIISCALLFVLLAGYGSISLGPKEFTRQLSSAVSVSAGVAANEYNTVAQLLLQKEEEVHQREIALAEREAAVMQLGEEKDTRLVAVVLSVGFLLLILILLNFYLDWKRRKES